MTKYNNIPLNLEILVEECAEVIHIKSKIFRFGIDNYYPKENGKLNGERLAQEIGDLLVMVDILVENGLFTKDDLEQAKIRKLKKLEKDYNNKALLYPDCKGVGNNSIEAASYLTDEGNQHDD